MQGLLGFLIYLGLYIFFCYCFKLICQNAGKDPGILIWIPVLQVFPLLQAAELEPWKIILFLVPIYNFVFFIIMWVKILKAINKNPWLVILMFVPIVNVFFIPYLAFSSNFSQPETSFSETPSSERSSSEIPSTLSEGAMSASPPSSEKMS